MSPVRLSPLVSYRCLDDVVILVDHRRGELLRLNRAAGVILDKLDQHGAEWTADEAEFVDVLRSRGLAVAEDEQRPTAPESPAQAGDAGERAPDGGERQRSALIDRLNELAADRCVPLHCQLELTYRCPLACAYCYLNSERPHQSAELSTSEVTRILDELADLGSLFLLLTGGELFLRDDLEQIVAHARRRRFAVTLLTSGFGLDRPMLARMAAGGLDCVQISLHGADAITHEAMTGVPGSFDAALASLRLARDQGVRTQAAIAVTRKSLDSLKAMLRLLDRERITPNVSHYVEPLRDGSLQPQELLIDAEGLRRVDDLLGSNGNARLAGRGPDDRPCGAASSTIAIDPTGTVYPCHSLRIPVGSARAQSLREIWEESKELVEIRALRVADLEDCASCGDRSWCNRCAGFSVAEGRGLTGHSPFDCLQAQVIASKN